MPILLPTGSCCSFKTNPCRPYRLRDNRTISQRNDGMYILIHSAGHLLKSRLHNRLAGIFYFHHSRLPIGARIFIRSSAGTLARHEEITTRENVLYEVIKAASRGAKNERSASILGSAGHRENERPERRRLSVAATALFRFSASFQPTKRTTDSSQTQERKRQKHVASTSKNHNNKRRKMAGCVSGLTLSLCREFSFGIFFVVATGPDNFSRKRARLSLCW
jgi:hypothetical protein